MQVVPIAGQVETAPTPTLEHKNLKNGFGTEANFAMGYPMGIFVENGVQKVIVAELHGDNEVPFGRGLRQVTLSGKNKGLAVTLTKGCNTNSITAWKKCGPVFEGPQCSPTSCNSAWECLKRNKFDYHSAYGRGNDADLCNPEVGSLKKKGPVCVSGETRNDHKTIHDPAACNGPHNGWKLDAACLATYKDPDDGIPRALIATRSNVLLLVDLTGPNKSLVRCLTGSSESCQHKQDSVLAIGRKSSHIVTYTNEGRYYALLITDSNRKKFQQVALTGSKKGQVTDFATWRKETEKKEREKDAPWEECKYWKGNPKGQFLYGMDKCVTGAASYSHQGISYAILTSWLFNGLVHVLTLSGPEKGKVHKAINDAYHHQNNFIRKPTHVTMSTDQSTAYIYDENLIIRTLIAPKFDKVGTLGMVRLPLIKGLLAVDQSNLAYMDNSALNVLDISPTLSCKKHGSFLTSSLHQVGVETAGIAEVCVFIYIDFVFTPIHLCAL